MTEPKVLKLQVLGATIVLFARGQRPKSGVQRTLVAGLVLDDCITEGKPDDTYRDELWFGQMIFAPALVVSGREFVGWKLGPVLTSDFTNPKYWSKILYANPNSDLAEFIANMKGDSDETRRN